MSRFSFNIDSPMLILLEGFYKKAWDTKVVYASHLFINLRKNQLKLQKVEHFIILYKEKSTISLDLWVRTSCVDVTFLIR